MGFIRYTGEGLELTYSYEDGGRTYSTLYSTGYLQLGGAISAGASASTLVGFDANGVGADIFSFNYYYGTFAEGVIYDLRADGPVLSGNYDDIAGVTAIEVSEYIADGGVKLSVINWSEDPSVRQQEEALIGELVDMGAELISQEDMDALCSLSAYQGPEVTWSVWDDGSPAADAAEEPGAVAQLSISFPSEELLSQPQSYSQFIADDSEYQVKIELTTDITVTSFRVLSLLIDNVTEDGTMLYSETELYFQDTLTPEMPLVLGLAFPGDLPNTGISYVDANGVERVYAIALSGQDGQPLLVNAQLNQ